jgi:hypothetical protein
VTGTVIEHEEQVRILVDDPKQIKLVDQQAP